VSSYRFCRTDDVSLLVDALNRCWSPYFPDEPAITPATFKRSIRDLQVWCSSCMVAFAGADPIAVLIGAKRPAGTLIHQIAVHPDHLRQGHGRHLLTSLSSKLAILGPPRMVAEVPETFGPARALFSACGYVEEARLIDYVLEVDDGPVEPTGMMVIPVTIDDLNANDLLGDRPPSPSPSASAGQVHPSTCWERSVETLVARKDDLEGVALASDESIEAFVLYLQDGELLSLRSFVEDGGARLKELLSQLRARGIRTFRLPKVHPAEISAALMEGLGFRPVGGHALYTGRARSE
jgi:GNAT superfamily N-acetyltransferase